MENKGKALLAILGLTIVGGLAVGIRAYGQMKYYDGRLSKFNELKPFLEEFYNLSYKMDKKDEKA
jgi:hypothetical protein